MMSPIEIVLRLIIGLVLFFFFVWDWSWRLYVTGELSDAIGAAVATIGNSDDREVVRNHFQVLSLFTGNILPTGAVINLLLMSRGFFGLALVMLAVWRIIESLIVTSEKRYTVDIFIVIFGASSFLFVCALALHGYNIGFFTSGGNLE